MSGALLSISPVISSIVCWTNLFEVDRGFRTCSSSSRLATVWRISAATSSISRAIRSAALTLDYARREPDLPGAVAAATTILDS
ncbi:MAG: hypothetical protein M0T75_01740 [Chloroflexi bacterium]|nr:hypothetical protein [Chloroflexota bacterium]